MTAFRRLFWLLTGLYWAFIFTLTHVPSLPPPPGHLNDKSAHFLAYGGLAGAIFISLWLSRPDRPGLWWRVLLICAAYGAVDEWLQALPFIHRSCELNDWFADVAGTLVAVTILGVVRFLVVRRPVADKMPA